MEDSTQTVHDSGIQGHGSELFGLGLVLLQGISWRSVPPWGGASERAIVRACGIACHSGTFSSVCSFLTPKGWIWLKVERRRRILSTRQLVEIQERVARLVESNNIPAHSERRWRIALFLLLLAAAALLFLVSGRAITSVAIPSLVAGWGSFRTGLWILKVDPQRFRARTCFAYYVAAAFWNAALGALVSIGIFVVVAEKAGIDPDMDEFEATLIVLLGGIVLNTAVGFVATIAALVGKVRVWVNPKLPQHVHGDLRLAAHQSGLVPKFNFAVFVVGTAVVFPLAVLGIFVLALLTGASSKGAEFSVLSLVGFVAVFALPFAGVPMYAWLSARVIARHPVECWPPATLDQEGVVHVYQQGNLEH